MKKPSHRKSDQLSPVQVLGLLGNLGFQIAVPLVIFGLLGRAVDRSLGTAPWFLLGGILISIVVTGALIYRHLKPLLQDDDSNHSPPDSRSV